MPALTKNAGESLWSRGFAYLADFADPYFLWLPLVVTTVLLVGLFRRLRTRRTDLVVAFAPVAAGFLHLVYVVKVGGDYMPARMLLPALFLVLLPILVVPRSKSLSVVTVVIALWAALCAGFLRYPSPDGSFRPIDDERAYYAA